MALFTNRRIGLALLLCLASFGACAAWPEKPIRFIVPSAPGGGADAAARILTNALAARLGQPIVIENRPGAAGSIGLDAIAKAAPDGYTVGMANLSNYTVATKFAKSLPFNPAHDFTPIGMIMTQPYLLGVNPSLPIRTIKELVEYAQANPDKLFYGSSGNGSALHVLMELFRGSAGIQATHAPYKSIVAAEMDLMAGQIQMMVDNFSTMAPFVESGKVRALAITGSKRSALMPTVPTMAEAGFPAVEAVTWAGVVGPARLPADVVKRLNSEINVVLSDPKVQKQYADLASDATPMTADEFAKFMKVQDFKWGSVIKKHNITAD